MLKYHKVPTMFLELESVDDAWIKSIATENAIDKKKYTQKISLSPLTFSFSKFKFTAPELDSRESRGVLVKLHDVIKNNKIIFPNKEKSVCVIYTTKHQVLIYFTIVCCNK